MQICGGEGERKERERGDFADTDRERELVRWSLYRNRNRNPIILNGNRESKSEVSNRFTVVEEGDVNSDNKSDGESKSRSVTKVYQARPSAAGRKTALSSLVLLFSATVSLFFL